eukprot:6471436-Amphidinium_carterae.1
MLTSNVLERFHCASTAPTAEAEVVATQHLPKHTFTSKLSEFSLGKEALEPLVKTRASWPNQKPLKAREAGLKWLALSNAESYGCLKEAWQSLMVPPGCMLCNRAKNSIYLVLKSTRWGCLTFAAKWRKKQQTWCVSFPDWSTSSLDVVCVTDHREWYVVKVGARAPCSSIW